MSNNDFDFTKAAKTFMENMKFDTSAIDDALTNAADFNSKLAKIALDAARKNAELTSDWTTETLKKVESKAGTKASDMADVAAAFSAEQAQAMQDKFAAYAEVAKAAQEKTIELFAAASKDVQDEITKKTKG
ncbi:MAG: phasin, PhaP [Rhodobacterales bacterium]|nr:MAG: phasin, PhaP [Rhodobacterales bacterium]